MINIKEYIGKKVYVELEKKSDDNDVTEEDKVQGGLIYKSFEDIMDVASEGDEFIEIQISKQFKTVNQCMAVVEVKDGKIIRKS